MVKLVWFMFSNQYIHIQKLQLISTLLTWKMPFIEPFSYLMVRLRVEYTPETMKLINELLKVNNAHLTIEDGDMDILKKACTRNDYFGLNYYQPSFVAAYEGDSTNSFNGTGEKGTSEFKFKGVGQHVKKPGVEQTDWDWNIYPEGLYDVLKRVDKDYPNAKKIYITENGLGYKDKYEGIGQDHQWW